jgi:hypothetical protein
MDLFDERVLAVLDSQEMRLSPLSTSAKSAAARLHTQKGLGPLFPKFHREAKSSSLSWYSCQSRVQAFQVLNLIQVIDQAIGD